MNLDVLFSDESIKREVYAIADLLQDEEHDQVEARIHYLVRPVMALYKGSMDGESAIDFLYDAVAWVDDQRGASY